MLENRNVEAIDRALELLTAVTASIRRLGGAPSTRLVDELLDALKLGTAASSSSDCSRASKFVGAVDG
jgi:hypothetical protein